jgi:hypothetical protein
MKRRVTRSWIKVVSPMDVKVSQRWISFLLHVKGDESLQNWFVLLDLNAKWLGPRLEMLYRMKVSHGPTVSRLQTKPEGSSLQ